MTIFYSQHDEDYSSCSRCGRTIYINQGGTCEDCLDASMSDYMGKQILLKEEFVKFFEPCSIDDLGKSKPGCQILTGRQIFDFLVSQGLSGETHNYEEDFYGIPGECGCESTDLSGHCLDRYHPAYLVRLKHGMGYHMYLTPLEFQHIKEAMDIQANNRELSISHMDRYQELFQKFVSLEKSQDDETTL